MTPRKLNNTKVHPITDGILNYLNMKSSGALLVTGDWGCGKTHFFKNHLFEKIKKETSFTPIIVSLFGIKELKELPERILCAYLDEKPTPLGSVARGTAKLANALPPLKKYIDLEKLLDFRDIIYKWIDPRNVLICLDDMERAIELIDIKEILGVINELVENKGYKVVAVANENFIVEKRGDEHQIFKEKVIEKTLTYIPNIALIFEEIVSSYKDSEFTDFMSDEIIKRSITLDDCTLAESNIPSEISLRLKEQLSNIRTIKFAIEHFYTVFSLYKEKIPLELKKPIIKKKLRNYWIFTLGISIEYKHGALSFEDNRELDEYQIIADMSNDCSKDDNYAYAVLFSQKFFRRFSERVIYHKELYNFITGGMKINYDALDRNMDKKSHIENKTPAPAHKLLSEFSNGYWKMKNDDASKKLEKLLEYVEGSKLKTYLSYIEAAIYLCEFKELIKENKMLNNRIKSGIDNFSKEQPNSIQSKTFLRPEILGDIPDSAKWAYEHIIKLLDQKIEREISTEKEELEEVFYSSLDKFLEKLATSKYLEKPIFNSFNEERIQKYVYDMSPSNAMSLKTLIASRYIKARASRIQEEETFLHAIDDGLKKIDYEKMNLTKCIIKKHLDSALSTAIEAIKGPP